MNFGETMSIHMQKFHLVVHTDFEDVEQLYHIQVRELPDISDRGKDHMLAIPTD